MLFQFSLPFTDDNLKMYSKISGNHLEFKVTVNIKLWNEDYFKSTVIMKFSLRVQPIDVYVSNCK